MVEPVGELREVSRQFVELRRRSVPCSERSMLPKNLFTVQRRRWGGFRRRSVNFALNRPPDARHPHPTISVRRSDLDQVHGARAAGVLLVGELDEALEYPSEASSL